jgi:hypothetical protein
MEKESTIFRGNYRDIHYTINRFKAFEHSGNEYAWTHYIHLNIDKQIKDEVIREKLWLSPKYDDKNRVSYEYYTSVISDIEFHGGCTWYSKESSIDEKTRSVKIGCDYQHSWDMDKHYSLAYVKGEVEHTIDSFLKITPVLKYCSGCGVYYEDVTKNGCGKCKYSVDKY